MLYNSQKDRVQGVSEWMFFWYQLTWVILDQGTLNRFLSFLLMHLLRCKYSHVHRFFSLLFNWPANFTQTKHLGTALADIQRTPTKPERITADACLHLTADKAWTHYCWHLLTTDKAWTHYCWRSLTPDKAVNTLLLRANAAEILENCMWSHWICPKPV